MASETKIQWCDSTFNPWTGCTKVSPGCDHCYAEGWAKRSGTVQWGPHAERRRTTPANWRKPLQWQREQQAFFATHGRRRRVFCASLADWLDNRVPVEWLVDLLELVRTTPNLDWLLLTKRIGSWRGRLQEAATFRQSTVLSRPASFATAVRDPLWQWLKAWLDDRPPTHVWLGATVVNQAEADRDIPKLLATPAAVRFLSIEPMLGPVDLRLVAVPPKQDQLRRPWDFEGSKFNALQLHDDDRFHQPPAKIDWVICGGESGPGARPANGDWYRSLRDQCAAAGVPFLFKQHGEWIDPRDLRRLPGGGMPGFGAFDSCRHDLATDAVRVGKQAAGRLLDGVEHNGFPAERANPGGNASDWWTK